MLQNYPPSWEIQFEEAYATAREALVRIDRHNLNNPPVLKVVLDTRVLRALLSELKRDRA